MSSYKYQKATSLYGMKRTECLLRVGRTRGGIAATINIATACRPPITDICLPSAYRHASSPYLLGLVI